MCSDGPVKVYLSGGNGTFGSEALGSSRTIISHSQILRCKKCHFGFAQVRPSDADLSQLYGKMKSDVYESEALGRSKTAHSHLRIIRQFLAKGRLLDVGCGSGEFLSCAADDGWEVYGIEPSESLSDSARKVLDGRGELINGTFQNAPLPQSYFDAITLWDVLEHVPDPLAVMRACQSLLKPGGYLFVNVPDLDSLEARVLKGRWPLLLQEHLNYFNRSSLRLCGELASLTWRHFGRRPAYFSVGYVLYRMSQHSIPGAVLSQRLISWAGISRILIPVPLGELYGVWQRQMHSS